MIYPLASFNLNKQMFHRDVLGGYKCPRQTIKYPQTLHLFILKNVALGESYLPNCPF